MDYDCARSETLVCIPSRIWNSRRDLREQVSRKGFSRCRGLGAASVTTARTSPQATA